MRVIFLVTVFFLASFSGCFGEEEVKELEPALEITEFSDAIRGQLMQIGIESSIEYTVQRPAGTFFVDEFGVFRDAINMTFDPSVKIVEFMILDTEQTSIDFVFQSGDYTENLTFELIDSDELMLVDGRRAFQTIDMLTSQYNNRWCASASQHEGGAAYEAAAEAMAVEMTAMGFDHVEVTRYDDDPDQLNIVGYNWGRINPDEYIVIGGHFDIAYMFTPPGGGTNEGANDDTSGSTVSLEMAQAPQPGASHP